MADLVDFELSQADFGQYAWIESVAHQVAIEQACSALEQRSGFQFYCPAILTRNGQSLAYTCNKPSLAIAYDGLGLGRCDTYFANAVTGQAGLFFPRMNNYEWYQGIDKPQRLFLDVLEDKFSIYNAYGIKRQFEGFVLLIPVGHNYAVDGLKLLYQQTRRTVLQFTIDYMNQFIDLYIAMLPALKFSRFANDPAYRKNVILGECHDQSVGSDTLSKREQECLHWLARGKTTAEIALILAISEHTVKIHRKAILGKLAVKNVAQAIYTATTQGLV